MFGSDAAAFMPAPSPNSLANSLAAVRYHFTGELPSSGRGAAWKYLPLESGNHLHVWEVVQGAGVVALSRSGCVQPLRQLWSHL